MNTENIYGDYEVTESATFGGVIYGAVTVKSGVTFINEGRIHGEVTVEKTAVLDNVGCIHGALRGEGFAELRGTYHGPISISHYHIHANAVINGITREEEETV